MTTGTGVCADHRRVSASDAFAYKNLSDPIQINKVPKHESHLCKTFENIPDSLKQDHKTNLLSKFTRCRCCN